MERYNKKPIQRRSAVTEYLNAGTAYARALQTSIESPSDENTQKVLEAGRVVMLKAAGLMSQETLAKLGELQRARMMKEE